MHVRNVFLQTEALLIECSTRGKPTVSEFAVAAGNFGEIFGQIFVKMSDAQASDVVSSQSPHTTRSQQITDLPSQPSFARARRVNVERQPTPIAHVHPPSLSEAALVD